MKTRPRKKNCPLCKAPLLVNTWVATALLSGEYRVCPNKLSCGYQASWTKNLEDNVIEGHTRMKIDHEQTGPAGYQVPGSAECN